MGVFCVCVSALGNGTAGRGRERAGKMGGNDKKRREKLMQSAIKKVRVKVCHEI